MHYQDFGDTNGLNTVHQKQQDHIIQVNQQYILLISEKICNDERCKFRLVTLRIFNHLLATADEDGKIAFSAKQLSRNLGVHYDTVTKCIKYLRGIGVIKTET